jgi:ribosome biogenesis GTPase A
MPSSPLTQSQREVERETLIEETAETEGRRRREAADLERRMRETLVTIGFIGHPNAGKSSLVNALLGKQATGVSHTPGKTKYLQTLTLADGFQVRSITLSSVNHFLPLSLPLPLLPNAHSSFLRFFPCLTGV